MAWFASASLDWSYTLPACGRGHHYHGLRSRLDLEFDAPPVVHADLSDIPQHKHVNGRCIVYRTCYQDDHGWQHLKRYLQDNTERALDRSDVPSLKESLCWTFIENQALFENASLDSLRSYFRERIKATHEREQPRAHGFVEAPRYIYFLKADQEVLQELKHTTNNPDLTKAYGLSHIKLIRADASTLTNDNGSVDEEDAYEAIDGCSDFDVGWMKIALKLTGPSFYESLYGSNEAWYAYYQRPPDELLSC